MSGLQDALRPFAPDLPLAVALSGGADSTALLLHCAQRWPGRVWAVHVHHGLQAAADGFESHCQALCQSLQVDLVVQRVNARPAAGQSPEDAARNARYAALRAALAHPEAMPGTQSIALGHHADDQAETLLLALSRGAGLPGLSAMPAHALRDGIHFYRPLLAVSAADIRQWLDEQGVTWVQDPSNDQLHYTRNRIRAKVLPVLQETFPQFRQTFARTASHAAQAQTLLDEIAREDLARVGVPPSIHLLQALSRERQANVLRHWLVAVCQSSASAAQLAELLDQIAACTTRGHHIQIKVGAGFVRRSMAHLDWYNPGVQ
jgi:tRNA(Ile)-lysidine synthase